MGLLRSIKSDYETYEHLSLACIVAIERAECKKIKAFYQKYKGKKDLPSDLVEGYKMVVDEEFESLKIDFSELLTFEIKHLNKV